MTVIYVPDVEIGHPGKISIAENKIGASYLPANVPIICEYDNKHPTDTKRFVAYLEYLY